MEALQPTIELIRTEVKVKATDPLLWLKQQQSPVKIYWADRKGNFKFAGIGVADCVAGKGKIDYPEIFSKMSKLKEGFRYFGGFAFDAENMDESWEAFGSWRFIIPAFELFTKDDETFFASNVFTPSKSAPAQFEDLPRLDTRADYPNQEQWTNTANKIIQQINSSPQEKVVLARKSTFTFGQSLDPIDVLARIYTTTPQCFHFCFQLNPTTAFIGASPERLYKRHAAAMETEALAGTRPRGESTEEDDRLKAKLLSSSKDACEHQYVVDTIKKELASLCLSYQQTQPLSILSLNGGHHLLTSFTGELIPGITDSQILTALHPTPAVAGCPTASALATIRKTESFARGWYAGPVGYVEKDSAEFTVAIRSGLIEGSQLSLYSGAGLVSSSRPQDEWEETEHKMNSFLKIFPK